ncbi:MAG: nucleoside hydrolase [Chloroflexota bacterium]|nr:nucleoside hydrolase [Chloroflexota bacterium]
MKIVLDCDTGIDDAVAIAYALACPEAEILGIGSVLGNVESDLAAENTLKLLKVAGRTEVPVALGAHRPLVRPPGYAKFVHGEDGLGNTYMPPSGLSVSGEHAADQIIRLARQHPGEVTLVPVGRLTNLALALHKEPQLPSLVKGVVLMGGAATAPGNVGPVAEANIWGDPEAASVVFAAPWPITMVGLDVTMASLLLEKHLECWREADTPLTRWLLAVVDFYFEYYSASFGRRACAMHDSVAVGIALGLVMEQESHLLPVSVVTHDGPAMGQTVVDRRPLVTPGRYSAEGANTRVMMKIDGEAFIDHMVERIALYQVR